MNADGVTTYSTESGKDSERALSRGASFKYKKRHRNGEGFPSKVLSPEKKECARERGSRFRGKGHTKRARLTSPKGALRPEGGSGRGGGKERNTAGGEVLQGKGKVGNTGGKKETAAEEKNRRKENSTNGNESRG